MKVEFAEQYNVPCLVLDGSETPDDAVERAARDECVYFDGEDHCYVICFPGRSPELYTEDALRRSLPMRSLHNRSAHSATGV